MDGSFLLSEYIFGTVHKELVEKAQKIFPDLPVKKIKRTLPGTSEPVDMFVVETEVPTHALIIRNIFDTRGNNYYLFRNPAKFENTDGLDIMSVLPYLPTEVVAQYIPKLKNITPAMLEDHFGKPHFQAMLKAYGDANIELGNINELFSVFTRYPKDEYNEKMLITIIKKMKF